MQNQVIIRLAQQQQQFCINGGTVSVISHNSGELV